MKRRNVYTWTTFILTIILLLVLAFFQVLWVVRGAPTNIMNQVGLQRARSERLTKDVLILKYRTSTVERAQALSETQDTFPLWVKTEQALQTGDSSLGLPHRPPPTVLQLVAQAQADYTPMQVALEHILANSERVDPTQIQIVLEHEHDYEVTMNQIVLAWEQYIDDVFYQLFWIETGIVGLILIITTITFALLQRSAKNETPIAQMKEIS